MDASSLNSLQELIRAARERYRAGAGPVLDVLLQTAGPTSAELIARLGAEAGVGVVDAASTLKADFTMLDLATAKAWRCAVLDSAGPIPSVATEDPWDEALVQRVSRRLGIQVTPLAATRSVLDALLGVDVAATPRLAADAPALGPVVGFVDAAIRAAFRNGASDVHFECDRSGVTVKHRQDGVLVRFARLDDTQSAQEVISRIKVLAQLDITERRLPQDGRFRFNADEQHIDLRVSIMPSVHGEDAVLRLLDKAQLRSRSQSVTLDALGFESDNTRQIRRLAALPSGMLLVTGPTGSGKTTTLYAALSEINTGEEKIVTIEDPVEYELPGVLQIPVNERKGLTFARGLRSILRHDPDRILVGEIRDAETAEIAVQSSLTGHLVFTTVHANSMTDVIGRFRHFGLDMFGLMSSLNGVVVQRLVRQLCQRCVGNGMPSEEESHWLRAMLQQTPTTVPRAIGCAECTDTGYSGRFVIAEVHLVDDILRDQVTGGAALSLLRQPRGDRIVESLAAQAARHVAQGRTTLEEVRRVVGWY